LSDTQIQLSDSDLIAIREKFLKELQSADSSESIQNLQQAYLGKKGSISSLYQILPRLSKEDRKTQGAQINELRTLVAEKIKEVQSQYASSDLESALKRSAVDFGLPLPQSAFQGRHPITQTIAYLIDILSDMGFDVGEGNEVEHENFNFTYLNIPEFHPARTDSDTFYVSRPYLLRTHTSPVQIHYMRKNPELPIQMIAPGRVYRADDDATHSPMFHQIEGLWVDVGIHLGHLKGVMTAFLQKVFDSDRVRFRPSYFPFTEPSTEVDIGCVFCSKKDRTCRVCKGTKWLEIMGAGVVHPKVLAFGKCPKQVKGQRVTGFAFGLGIERVAMLIHKISDMRLLFDNDPRILNQTSRVRALPLQKGQK
jgi:phenylalanyl-tRNA synthetase alpha chain